MNKLAIITGFLGGVKNRFMVYQDDRALQQKFEMAARIEGVEGLELGYPEDFNSIAELKELPKVSAVMVRRATVDKFYDTIARIITAYTQDTAPRTAIELSRAALPSQVRPDMTAIDENLKVIRLSAARQAA